MTTICYLLLLVTSHNKLPSRGPLQDTKKNNIFSGYLKDSETAIVEKTGPATGMGWDDDCDEEWIADYVDWS